MSLVVNYSMDQVEFLNSRVVGIADNSIQEEVEMVLSRRSSIKVMKSCDAIYVGNFLFHPFQKISGVSERNWRNCSLIFTEFQNMFMVIKMVNNGGILSELG